MNKDFGENTENNFHNSLEGFSIYDKLSARTLNRPILNILAEQESVEYIIKALLQKLFKEDGIIHEAYEGFDPLKLKVINIKERNYLRIPTGIAIVNGGKDLIINKPEISMQERKFGKLLGMDLNDQFNDITINKFDNKYYILMSFNNKLEDKTETRIPVNNNCESWELFSNFVNYYDEYIIVPDGNLKYYNVMERYIDITDIDKNKRYYLYYTEEDVPVTGTADLSKKYFISSKDNETGIKIYYFDLNSVNGSITIDNPTKVIKDIIY